MHFYSSLVEYVFHRNTDASPAIPHHAVIQTIYGYIPDSPTLANMDMEMIVNMYKCKKVT